MNTVSRPVVKITPKRTLTYLGSRAVTYTEHHDKSALGLRTIYTSWIDDATVENGGHLAGTTTRIVVKGDGRRSDFEIVEPIEVVA